MAEQPLPPITASADSSRKLNLLLINPNATKHMTATCLSSLQPVLPPDVILTGFTAPIPAPSAIESSLDGVLSAAACIRALTSPGADGQPLGLAYDGFLVACFSAHPLIDALREEFDRPAMGIMEAALLSARLLGGRVGVVATSARSGVHAERAVRELGMEGCVAGIEHCGLGVLELESKGEKVVCGIMAGAGTRLVERGADVLVLGCAGMSALKAVVEKQVGEGVQVVDGVVAGVQLLSGLVRMGAKTAKRGVYRSSAVERKARGQEYL